MKQRYLFFVLWVVLLAAGIPVLADAPDQTITHMQVEGGDLWVCDTNANDVVDATDIHVEGRFWFNGIQTTEFDDTGEVVKITWMTSFHGVVTNLNTGEVVTRDRFEGREVLDFTTETYTQSGATRHFFRPGEGTLYHDAGRIVIDIVTGEIIEEAGPHPLADASLTSFCQFIDGAGEEIFWEPQPATVTVLGPS